MPEYSVISTSFAKMLGLADKHSYIYRHNRIRSSYFIDNDEKTFSRKDKLHTLAFIFHSENIKNLDSAFLKYDIS